MALVNKEGEASKAYMDGACADGACVNGACVDRAVARGRVEFIASKVKIGVAMVLVKLFLKRYLICLELNSSLVAIYSLILSSVHSIGFSSCKVLNSDCAAVIHLSFLIYTL